jgi:chromosome partitioning protein
MRTIAIVNQKGGCGKTITSINLSAFLAQSGRRVLVVDMDPQGHATLGLSPGGWNPARSMYDVLLPHPSRPQITIADIARPVGENLDLAPADIRLSAIPDTLSGVPGREETLHRAFQSLDGRYDYVIVDCPPNVGLLTFNALRACDEVLIPMDPSFFSLHGIGKLFETIQLLERETGHRISARVLVTLYSGRTTFMRAVLDEVHRHLAGEHYATVIRQSVKLAEAASHGVPITQYATRSVGFEDYQSLATEILQQETPAPAEAPAEQIAAASSPVVTAEGVVFSVEAPDASMVQLAGDFNDWMPDLTEMEPVGGIWLKTLQLAPGRYRYRYVVDGEWRCDPCNTAMQPSPFGGYDSLLVVESTRVPGTIATPEGSHELA